MLVLLKKETKGGLESVSNVVVVAQTLKWKWEGLVARTDQRRWAHASPMWDVILGERRTQRPKSR
jgi:hypothetical protein